MNPFKSYTFTWWQIGVFKLALLAIGCAIGAYWHEFFGGILIALIVIAVVASIYIIYVSMKQQQVRKYGSRHDRERLISMVRD